MITALAATILISRQTKVPEISYEITPVPKIDRTDLFITVKARGFASEALTVSPPLDGYGTPGLSRYMGELQAVGGTTLMDGAKTGEWQVTPAADGTIHLRYGMSYDPRRLQATTFGPNVGPNHFYTALGQSLICLGDWTEPRETKISVRAPSSGWNLFSDIGPDPRELRSSGSYRDLRISTIGAVRKGYRQAEIRGKRLSMFVPEEVGIPKDRIYRAIERIVTLQRGWFSDYDYPFYNVVVLPREDSIAGTCLRNFFVCFVKPDVTELQLNRLMAHEMFHNWLGQRITIKPPSESDVHFRTSWFIEGFTEYFGRLILRDAKLITDQQFADFVNDDIMDIADNPNRLTTYEHAVQATKSGKYDTAFQKLGYYRGALMALRWDAQMKKRGKSLSGFIRQVESRVRKSGVAITEGDLLALARSFGADDYDFQRYIINGEPIQLDPTSLGPRFSLMPVPVPPFEPGFSVSKSFASRKVADVIEDGPAHRAGLRDGMELVDIRNWNRFSYAWSRSKPLTVVIRENGQERTISFMPFGQARPLMIFIPHRGK